MTAHDHPVGMAGAPFADCPGCRLDERAERIRREAFERSGRRAEPWDDVSEDERARWRRAAGDQ